jgi:hypothetical protein
MTAWAHLPNAAHIDSILADVQARPEAWAAARAAAWTAGDAARAAAGDAAWDAARAAARLAAWHAAWHAAGHAAWAAREAAWHAAWLEARALDLALDAAWEAVLALVAWDDCAHLLSTDPDQVRVLALLGHPPAVLLLPAVIALNKSMVCVQDTERFY